MAVHVCNGNSLDNFFMANQRKRNDNFVQVASERRAALKQKSAASIANCRVDQAVFHRGKVSKHHHP